VALCGYLAYIFKYRWGIPIGDVDPKEWHTAMSKLRELDVLQPGHDPDIVKRWTTALVSDRQQTGIELISFNNEEQSTEL